MAPLCKTGFHFSAQMQFFKVTLLLEGRSRWPRLQVLTGIRGSSKELEIVAKVELGLGQQGTLKPLG